MQTRETQLDILKSVGIFAGTPDVALTRVAALLREEDFPAGEVIFRKDTMGTCLYIIAEGRVRVHDGTRIVNELGRGEVFGEMAVLDAAPRSATITAVSDTRLFRLEQDDLYRLMHEEADISMGIIRVLSGHLRSRVSDVSHLYDRKEQMESELRIGRQIQAGFLPDRLPQAPGWEVAGTFHPAREVAGDFYDAFSLAGGSLMGLVMADVCGKGVGAALFMALIRSLFRAYAEQNFASVSSHASGENAGENALRDAALRTVENTGDYIARTHGNSHMFATAFLGILDPLTGALTYVNGGHEPPLILEAGRVSQSLDPTGPAVGLMPGMQYRVKQTDLGPGATLFMYTDGVTDARDPEGEFFGKEKLMPLINAKHTSAAELLASIEANLTAHIAGATQFDDITMLAVKRTDKEPDTRQTAI